MKELIESAYQQGLTHNLYSWINGAGVLIGLAYSLFHGKKLGIKLWKMIIILAIAFGWQVGLQSAFWPILQQIRETHFLGIQTAVNSIVRTFALVPIIAFPLAKIFKYKVGHVCDAIVMLPLLISAIAQLACVFTGCCRGYECAWGIYNVQTNQYHFPTPILETILTLMIFAFLVYCTVKSKFVSEGKLYPTMMIMYGPMRFVCEMLRDNEKIFLGMSAVGVHALIIYLVGSIWIYLIYRKENKLKKQLKAIPEETTEEKKEENTEESAGVSSDTCIDENCEGISAEIPEG